MIRKLVLHIFAGLLICLLKDAAMVLSSFILISIHFNLKAQLGQMQILYLQENQITPSNTDVIQAIFSDLCPNCVGVTQYAVSFWARKSGFDETAFNTLFRLSNDPAYYIDYMF